VLSTFSKAFSVFCVRALSVLSAVLVTVESVVCKVSVRRLRSVTTVWVVLPKTVCRVPVTVETVWLTAGGRILVTVVAVLRVDPNVDPTVELARLPRDC
jgi:hypothetical protein